MKKLLIALTILSTSSFAFGADVLSLNVEQCKNLKIALKDADLTLDDIKNPTDIDIKNAVRYSLTQNQAGRSLTADTIDAPWLNTDMSYNQLIDAAKTCKMPVAKEPAKKKVVQPKINKAQRASQCMQVENLYNYTIDFASKTGSLERVSNLPVTIRNKELNKTMDMLVKVVANQTKIYPFSGELTWDKVTTAYANCVAYYQ